MLLVHKNERTLETAELKDARDLSFSHNPRVEY